jgi:hypothetical protein
MRLPDKSYVTIFPELSRVITCPEASKLGFGLGLGLELVLGLLLLLELLLGLGVLLLLLPVGLFEPLFWFEDIVYNL